MHTNLLQSQWLEVQHSRCVTAHCRSAWRARRSATATSRTSAATTLSALGGRGTEVRRGENGVKIVIVIAGLGCVSQRFFLAIRRCFLLLHHQQQQTDTKVNVGIVVGWCGER